LTPNDKLESLRSLDIILHSTDMTRHPRVLVNFLRSFSPLEYLALTGETHSTRCQRWIAFHASSLKRMQLTAMDCHDSTFDLVSLSATMQPPSPLLEHLSITIKQSKGNSDEVSMYKILGAMPKLQGLCSDWTLRHRLNIPNSGRKETNLLKNAMQVSPIYGS
jgi:hypothetical protein